MVGFRHLLWISQPPWWYSYTFYRHHNLLGGILTLSIDTTASLVVFSTFYRHHILHGGIQTLHIDITASLVVCIFLLCRQHSLPGGSQYFNRHHSFPWWYLVFPIDNIAPPSGIQTLPIDITASLMAFLFFLLT